MKSIKAYRTQSKKDADSLLKDGMSTLQSITDTLTKHFPHDTPSKAEAAFSAEQQKSSSPADLNPTLSNAIPATHDLLTNAISNIQTLERFIALHHPQMEDGNNFGVTVQMTIAKHLKETREEITKRLDEIPKYYSTRADAVDKLNLTKVTSSETKTSTKSESTGGKDGDENKTSNTTVTEEKKSNGSEPDVHRVKHVVSIDVQCYVTLKLALVGLLDGYVTILDNMEKNMDKLEAPKGSSGGNSMGMY